MSPALQEGFPTEATGEPEGGGAVLAQDKTGVGFFGIYKQLTGHDINSFNQALVILREVGDKKAIGDAINGLGAVHDKLGESLKALSFYQQALVLPEELNDSKRIAIAEGRALPIAKRLLRSIAASMALYGQAIIQNWYKDRLGIAHPILCSCRR